MITTFTLKWFVRALGLASFFFFLSHQRNWPAFWSKDNAKGDLHSASLKYTVNIVLDNALTEIMAVRGLIGLNSLVTPSPIGDKKKQIQSALICSLRRGVWQHKQDSRLSKQAQDHLQVAFPTFTPKSSCFLGAQYNTSHASLLCSWLGGKKVLLVGSTATFYLHSLWLHALSSHENRSHSCHGPEFCTFHHICQPSSDDNRIQERFKTSPKRQDLQASGSSVLRYSMSTTLTMVDDFKDAVYRLPSVDGTTGIRIRNSFWIGKYRQSDVVVMNRGPSPSPSWTYVKNDPRGNWTFVDNLIRNPATNYLATQDHAGHSLSDRIVNAALHTTMEVFLPSVIDTCQALALDVKLHRKVLIWHGSWYLQPQCLMHSIFKNINDSDLSDPWLNSDHIDPWSLYYNSQVYMQDRILEKLLPYFGILFLPMTVPRTIYDLTPLSSSMARGREGYHNDCIRYPWNSSHGEAMEKVFLGGLAEIIRAL